MSSPKETEKDNKGKVFLKILKYVLFITPVWELIKYNKRLTICSQIVGVKKGSIDNFLGQKRKINILVTLAIIPFLSSLVVTLLMYRDLGGFLWLKPAVLDMFNSEGNDCISFINNNSKILFLSLNITINYTGTHFFLYRFKKIYTIRERTIDLVSLCKRLGLIDETSEEKILWTDTGVLMELKNGNAQELVKNMVFWNQINMEPGLVLYPKKEKRMFYVLSGFELADSYDFTLKD